MVGISGAFEDALAIQPPLSHHMVQRSPWISTSLVWLSRHLSAEHKGGLSYVLIPSIVFLGIYRALSVCQVPA